MIKDFTQFINEKFELDDSMFNMKTEYIDSVFDKTIGIILQENGISEEFYSNYKNLSDDLSIEFLNEEFRYDLDNYEKSNKRVDYCAEFLYDKYLCNFLIIEKKENGKDSLMASKSISKEMKDKISPYVNSSSRYINKQIFGLKIPKINGKSFDGVSLGADKDGFFVYTHRAKSKSYQTVEKIPNKDIIFIETTG